MLFMATLQNFCDQERRSQQHHSFDRPRDTGANNITILTYLATPAQTTSEKIRTLRRRRRQHHKIFVENETHYSCHRFF